MGIKDRIKFIARSYLSSIMDDQGTPRSTPNPDVTFEDATSDQATTSDHELKGMSEDDFEKQWAAFEEEQRRYKASQQQHQQSSQQSPYRRPGERTLEQCYQNLECPTGATLQVVKGHFRRLMKKYHPDLQPQDKRSQEAALKITQIITESFNQLEKHLESKGQR